MRQLPITPVVSFLIAAGGLGPVLAVAAPGRKKKWFAVVLAVIAAVVLAIGIDPR